MLRPGRHHGTQRVANYIIGFSQISKFEVQTHTPNQQISRTNAHVIILTLFLVPTRCLSRKVTNPIKRKQRKERLNHQGQMKGIFVDGPSFASPRYPTKNRTQPERNPVLSYLHHFSWDTHKYHVAFSFDTHCTPGASP